MKANVKNIMGLVAIVMGFGFVSCSPDYDGEFEMLAVNAPAEDDNKNQDTTTVDNTRWSHVIGNRVVVNNEGEVKSQLFVQRVDNGIDTLNLIYNLNLTVTAPERVMGNKGETNFYQGAPAVYGEWNSIEVENAYQENEEMVYSRSFEMAEAQGKYLYTIVTSCTLRRAKIEVNGRFEEFPVPSVNVNYLRGEETRNNEEVEINDSIFNRETVTSLMTLKAEVTEVKFTSTTKVDRFVKVIEKEGENNEVVEPTVPSADFYAAGLVAFRSANKFYNKNTNGWSDGILFEGKDNFYIVVYNYTVNNSGKEKFVSKDIKTIAKNSISKETVMKYNAVMCAPNGEILPGVLNVDGTGWTIEGPVNKGDNCYETHTKQEANNSGIKNQPEDNNAACSAILTASNNVKVYNDSKYITVAVKSSVHNYTFTIADANLK